MEYYSGFGSGPDLFSIMFFVIFFIIITTFIVNAIKGVSEWSSNNKQPILDVNCTVVSKRTNVTHNAGHTDANGHHHSGSSSTTYYITFEFESKDRMEFKVSGKEYGTIVEKDYGKLKFQGTRFLDFNRSL
ncbi:MAG: DUF2500 domain-containing protein [Peptostreptococcaceae bacterium]